MDKSENRYDMRKNETGVYWTVYDIFTGEPAEMNGASLTHCQLEEADDLVDLLNRQYIDRRKGTTH